MNEFEINIPIQNQTTETDLFLDFLNLVNFEKVEIDSEHQEYYLQFFIQLGNYDDYMKIQNYYSNDLLLFNAVEFLKAKSVILPDQKQDEIISYIATNFENISKDDLKTLSIETIEEINKDENLTLKNEDTLLEFILDLYNENHESAFLFENDLFFNVSEEMINEFMNTVSLDDINDGIWRSLWIVMNSSKTSKIKLKANEINCLFLGLNSSGKSDILNHLMIKYGNQQSQANDFNAKTIGFNGYQLRIQDIEKNNLNSISDKFYEDADIAIFVVNANDVSKIDESIDKLQMLLEKQELKNCKFAILYNIQDIKSNKIDI